MDVSGDLPRCPECGEPMDDGADRGCPHCKPTTDGTDVRSADLKVLRGEGSRDPVAASDVRLVRQVKMPTVDALANDGDALDRLPSKVCAMEDAIGTGDLRAANRLMDDAMGSLLEGPGYRHGRSRRRLLAVVLWVWCGILVLLAVLAWWLR